MIPYEADYNDLDCAGCGTRLEDDSPPLTWGDQGFCGMDCAIRSQGPLVLQGRPAVELAQLEEARGGAGFDRATIARWLDAARPHAPIFMHRMLLQDWPLKNDGFKWRLHSGGREIASSTTLGLHGRSKD